MSSRGHETSRPLTRIVVCVVTPGTAPAGIAAIDYDTPFVLPPPDQENINFGGTDPGPLQDVDIEAYFDCTAKQWKCKVTQAKNVVVMFWRRRGRTEASAALAVNNPDSDFHYCKMIDDLGPSKLFRWSIVEAAIEAHEKAHLQEWKDILNPRFATMKATIEALTVDHECGRTAAQAAGLIKALPAYDKAIDDVNTNANRLWAAVKHENENTKAAERPILDEVIAAIESERVDNEWPACPKGPFVYLMQAINHWN